MTIFPLLAQDSADKVGSAGNFFGSFPFMILIMFLFMWLLIIRPQQKQRKELAARIASLKKGDQVITAGGMHGTVHHISERTVTLKLSEGVFVPFEKTAVQTVTQKSGDKKDPAKKNS